MPHLALYTFGVLKSPLADPAPLTRAFHDSGEAVYRQIGRHPGFLARAEAADGGRGTLFDLDWGAWGAFAVPAWYGKGRTVETIALAATLSLWTDPHSAFDAVHTGPHRAALNRRYDWFDRTGRPGYVFWWVSDGVVPTWQDGVFRLEHLHDHGSAPHAFTFHHSFAPDGTATRTEGIGPKSDQVR
ncbi:DUF3291 domain-containing protein [Streptantibioticus silvisoli]|uniref:DUF3291 domain-containing protein n=1 Tax=Streptantibioticus silvisoli TaxID=2705255 RepID=A0ABT6W116_9ACTN|nr:DUF3291 domain-containing protein [Streptantibioticus silvisoli]MDI5964437.1 DUF3291 domain-containing protein [Streptantibioticus silvisoli]